MSNTVHLFQVHFCKSNFFSWSFSNHFCPSHYTLLLTVFAFPLLLIEVMWGHISDAAVMAAKEDLGALQVELQNDQTKRWEAIGMLKHILASVSLPWELKKCAINFLICITDGNISKCDEHTDCSSYMPGLYSALQVCSCHLDFIYRCSLFLSFCR